MANDAATIVQMAEKRLVVEFESHSRQKKALVWAQRRGKTSAIGHSVEGQELESMIKVVQTT